MRGGGGGWGVTHFGGASLIKELGAGARSEIPVIEGRTEVVVGWVGARAAVARESEEVEVDSGSSSGMSVVVRSRGSVEWDETGVSGVLEVESSGWEDEGVASSCARPDTFLVTQYLIKVRTNLPTTNQPTNRPQTNQPSNQGSFGLYGEIHIQLP